VIVDGGTADATPEPAKAPPMPWEPAPEWYYKLESGEDTNTETGSWMTSDGTKWAYTRGDEEPQIVPVEPEAEKSRVEPWEPCPDVVYKMLIGQSDRESVTWHVGGKVWKYEKGWSSPHPTDETVASVFASTVEQLAYTAEHGLTDADDPEQHYRESKLKELESAVEVATENANDTTVTGDVPFSEPAKPSEGIISEGPRTVEEEVDPFDAPEPAAVKVAPAAERRTHPLADDDVFDLDGHDGEPSDEELKREEARMEAEAAERDRREADAMISRGSKTRKGT
jgi:hypothetical protein